MTRLSRQLLLKLAHWSQGSSMEPFGHFPQPEDEGSVQETTCGSKASTWDLLQLIPLLSIPG